MTFRTTILFILVSLSVSAQGLTDLVRKNDIQPALSLDNRYTVIMGNEAVIWGGKIGFDIEKKYHTGFGYYWLNTDITMPKYMHDLDIKGKLDMSYFTYYFDFTIYQSHKWEVRIPMDIGYGHKYFDYTGKDDIPHSESGNLVLFEPSISVTYRVWKWVGVGASVGQRQVMLSRLLNTRDISGPFAGVKLKIFLFDFYDDFIKASGAGHPASGPH